jgi:hypothetical protein
MRRRLDELEADERYARERYDLYRAKVYGPRLTSLQQLRQLEHAWRLAETRLRLARSTKQPDASNANRALR